MSDINDDMKQQLHDYAKMLKTMTPLEVLESMTYDFRGNLTTINGFATISLNTEDNQEYIEYINLAVKNMIDYLEMVTKYVEECKANIDDE